MSIILQAGAARMKLEAENYEARITALEAQLAEAKEQTEFWKASSEAADEYIANMRTKLSALETDPTAPQLAEAVKRKREEISQHIHIDMASSAMFVAARRVREGGKVE